MGGGDVQAEPRVHRSPGARGGMARAGAGGRASVMAMMQRRVKTRAARGTTGRVGVSPPFLRSWKTMKN